MTNQLANGLWTDFDPKRNPFVGPNAMADNLRLIDDHIAAWTRTDVLAAGSDYVGAPIPGETVLFDDGTYAVYNAGAWRQYPAGSGANVLDARSGAALSWDGNIWRNSVSVLGNADGASAIGYGGTTLNRLLLQGIAHIVGTIEELRSLDSARFSVVLALGYYAPGDRRSRLYRIDASDRKSDDDGGWVIVGSDGARWRLVSDGVVRVRDFGTKENGADDTLALRAAIARLPSSSAVLDFENGDYFVTPDHGLLTAPDSAASTYALVIANIEGLKITGNGARIRATLQPTDMVTMAVADCTEIEISGVKWDGQNKYTAESIPSFKQQLLHILNPHKAWIHHCRFANSANIGMLVTAQYKVIAPSQFPHSNNVEISSCTFENCLQNSTYGTGIDGLNIHHCTWINPIFAAWKMSATADTSAVPDGDIGRFKGVTLSDNIVMFNDDYVNPMSALGDGPNTYRTLFDCVSYVKHYKIHDNHLDVGGKWNDGVHGGIGIKIEPASENHAYLPKINTRVDVHDNKIYDIDALDSVAISVSPFIDDIRLHGNEYFDCYYGIAVVNITVPPEYQFPDASRSSLSIRGEEFHGTIKQEINIAAFYGSEIHISGVHAPLRGVDPGNSPFIYVHAVGRTLDSITVNDNHGWRNINITANARNYFVERNSAVRCMSRGLDVGAETITPGSRAVVRCNVIESPLGIRIDGIAGPGGWVECDDNIAYGCTTGAYYANRLGDGVSLAGSFQRNTAVGGTSTGNDRYNIQNSVLLINVQDVEAPANYPRLTAAAANGSIYTSIDSTAGAGVFHMKVNGTWLALDATLAPTTMNAEGPSDAP